MKASQVLREALELLGESGENWLNHCPADDGPTHCSVTAVYMAGASDSSEIRNEAMDALHDAVGLSRLGFTFAPWNDSHTFAEVKKAFKRAIANCEAEGR